MDAEVFLTHTNISDDDVQDRTVVVIDVLRSCSTIVTALHRGARAIMPVSDMAQAGKIAGNLDPEVCRLGGERDGEMIEGYDLGNSPLEYTREAVEDRDIIMNTTNGTRALERAKEAEHLVAACFLNAGRVVDFVQQHADAVTIVCAGRYNRLALEDTLCAGLILDRLWDGHEPRPVTDSAHTAFTLFHTDSEDLESALWGSNHAEWLARRGYREDLEYCFQIDSVPVLPYYTENRLLLYEETEFAA